MTVVSGSLGRERGAGLAVRLADEKSADTFARPLSPVGKGAYPTTLNAGP